MDNLAFIVPYWNHTRNPLVAQRYAETLDWLGTLTPHVYGAEASMSGDFDFDSRSNVKCFRVNSCLWYKENLINKLARELPESYTKLAWLDGDLRTDEPGYVSAICAALDTADFVQMCSRVVRLGPTGKRADRLKTTAFAYKTSQLAPMARPASPGYGWAARRSSLAAIGYLPDKSIVGAGDLIFALAVVRGLDTEGWAKTVGVTASRSYIDYAEAYVNAAREKTFAFDYVDYTLHHFYHGDYAKRMYGERFAALKTFKLEQLSYDQNGLLQYDNPVSEAMLRDYFQIKNS